MGRTTFRVTTIATDIRVIGAAAEAAEEVQIASTTIDRDINRGAGFGSSSDASRFPANLL